MMLMLLDRSGPVHVVVTQPPLVVTPAPPVVVNAVSILDVAGRPDGWDVQQLVAMVPISAGEQITALDDQPIGPSLVAAGEVTGLERQVRSNGYLDVTIARATSTRRVLVVVH